ncbi:MAG: 5-formyltetrahydrofolate cyclo-ligase [Candidatus Omnitrophota bacterium]
MKDKKALRRSMKLKIDSQSKSERRKKSTIIQKKLFARKEFLASKCIMVYVSKGTGEVETGPIIEKALRMGKKVVLPVTLVREKSIKPVLSRDLKHGLKRGPYGIYEPEESKSGKRPLRIKDIDLVIVPGLAFDRRNNRLGHGRGYYDSFLRRLAKDTSRIGLGFRFQLLRTIPTTGTDFSLTEVITN